MHVGRFLVCAVVIIPNPWSVEHVPAIRTASASSAVQITGLSGRELVTAEIPLDCHHRKVNAVVAHRCGVALLLAGRTKDAVQALTRATELSSESAAYWSDLAVALHDSAQQRDNPQVLPDALAAADHALRLEGDYVPALFARASTLASMGIVVSAIHGYQNCQRLVPNTPWGRDAVRRLHALGKQEREYNEVSLKEAIASSDDARLDNLCQDFGSQVIAYAEDVLLVQWAKHTLAGETAKAEAALRTTQRLSRALHRAAADTALMTSLTAIDAANEKQGLALAKGHRSFGAARAAYASGLMDVAGKEFQAASRDFEEGWNPAMWVKAGLLYNNCLDDPDALTVPGFIVTDNPSLDQSFKHDLDALATFERADGAPEPAMTLDYAVSGYAAFGHRPEAWRALVAHFRKLRSPRDNLTLQLAIHAAADAEMANGRWESAYSLFDLASAVPSPSAPWPMIHTLVWRSAMRFRLGWPTVDADLALLRNASKQLDSRTATSIRPLILFAEALNLQSRDPAAAVKLLTRVIEARPKVEERLVLEALFVRSKSHRVLGDTAAATADLEEALQSIAVLRHRAMNYRQAYAETAEEILDELASVYDETEDSRRLLAAIRLAVEGETTSSNPGRSGLTVARYVKSGTHMLIIVSHAGQDRIVRVAPDVDIITAASEELVACIEAGTRTCNVEGARLGAWLLDPITELNRSSSFHVLLPPVLSRIPLSVLRHGPAGRRLIEDTNVVVMDERRFKATDTVTSIHVHPPSKPTERVVAIGDPRFDTNAFATQSRIPGARREAEDVIKTHGRGVLLTGDAATPPRAGSALSAARVADIATHAVIREGEPSRSYLLLAPTKSSSGLLYLHEIENLDLCNLELVVLAGCQTAAPMEGEGDASALALAFLGAGAKNVIGSMWEIEDDVACIVSLKLHREITRGTVPAEALRRVQLEMMRSPDERLSNLRAWGGLQIYASTE